MSLLPRTLPIIDPHHHLFDARKSSSTTPMPQRFINTFGSKEKMANYLPDDLIQDATNINVVATVYVEAGTLDSLSEAKFVLRVIKNNIHVARGMVAKIDLLTTSLPSMVDTHVQAHVEILGKRLKGFRFKVACDPKYVSTLSPTNARFGENGNVICGAKRLGELNYTIDLWCYHHQLPQIEALARAVPGTTFVLDHVGTPILFDVPDPSLVYKQWQTDMARLAVLPNIIVKIGGLCMNVGFGHLATSSPFHNSQHVANLLAPYVVETVRLFTSSRCCFESNFPMDRHAVSYATLWEAFAIISARWDLQMRRDLFFATANRVYRLELDVPPLEAFRFNNDSMAAL